MSEHTLTPWRNACFQVYGADNSKIAHTGMGQLPPYRSTESEANAAFIVKAVNSHDALLDLAKNVGGFHDSLLQTANLNVIRSALREYREQARDVLEALAKAATS